MAYIARRDGKLIQANCIGGSLTIIHEADNGVLVISWPRRKHWKAGYPEIPVRYQLARLLTGDEAVEARMRTICNSAHYGTYPDVITLIGDGPVTAGKHWRAVRSEMVEKAARADINA